MTGTEATPRRLMDELAVIAARGLAEMADGDTGLFPHKVVLTPAGTATGAPNPFYSAISVIGLVTGGVDDVWRERVRLGTATDALVAACAASGARNGMLVGTATSALALAGDARATDLVGGLDRDWTPAGRSSMEIGLVVSGLVAAMERQPACRDRAARLAAAGARELMARWSSASGLFDGRRRLRRPRDVRPSSLLSRNLTSFAHQVYAVHGLAEHARVVSGRVPDCAVRTADRLVQEQGPLGQWWWIHSARDGRVIDGYPVYSVHQDAMAFLALAPLENLGAGRYAEALWRGLRWVDGANELQESLVHRDRNLIVRCIQRVGSDADGPSGLSRPAIRAARLASWGLRPAAGTRAEPSGLEILSECRSYHLGWLLYARSLVSGWSD
ncbi:MAG: hypothetical protein QOC64_570 [Solirubrobacteraceae bacterium]|nr:hypothetical protein [Solirubrobacteraceae bacterium]